MKFYSLRVYYLLLLLFMACHRPYHIQQHGSRFYAVDADAGTDSTYWRMLQPYKSRMDSQMQVVIGRADTVLYKTQPEGTLGNFMADAMLAKALQEDAATDAAILNYGGIRIPYISAGKITMGKIFEMMPFDNMLTIVEIPGDTLIRFCNHIAMLGGWPVSGIRFVIADKQASNVLINGKPIERNRMYKIATNDYVATGGDNCSFLVAMKRSANSILIRDVLIEYIKTLTKQNRSLHPYIEKRISHAE